MPITTVPVHPLRFIAALTACFTLAACAHAAEEPASQSKRGFFGRVFGVFGGSPKAKPQERKGAAGRLDVSLALEPLPLKLSENRQLKVTLQVANRTKKFAQLEFQTTQRIEVVIRNKAAKLVEQWSEDRTFENQPGLISINPGERLEYTAMVATRDLVAGESYIVEAFFPQYEGLRVQKEIVPEK